MGTTLSMNRLGLSLICQWPLWVSASFLLAMGCGQNEPAGGNAPGTQTYTDPSVTDACATNNGGCDANASCTNATTPGDAPICECLNGFTGDGQTCTAKDISCAPTQVPHSSHAATGALTGEEGDQIEVVCDAGYGGGGTWTCTAAGDFIGNACRPCRDLIADADPLLNTPDSACPAFLLERDRAGTPHILAKDLASGFHALGKAQAEDRLFQMHFRRMKMEGRLGEYLRSTHLGGKQVDRAGVQADDQIMLVLGYARSAQRTIAYLDSLAEDHPKKRYLNLLEAYSEGVNEEIQRREAAADLGHAFDLFGITDIHAWQPFHSLLVWDWVSDFVSNPLTHLKLEILKAIDCADGLCDEPTCDWVVDEAAAVVPDPSLVSSGSFSPPLIPNPKTHLATACLPPGDVIPTANPSPTETHLKASHALVVHGDKTETGKPVLWAEPQLDVDAPAFWHEFHLKVGGTEGIQSRGAGLAGAPGFFIFWNQHSSHTITAGSGDLFDLVALDIPDTAQCPASSCYLLDGQPQNFEEVNEPWHQSNDSLASLTVKRTAFGPVVNGIFGNFEPNHLAEHTYALIAAEAVDETSHSIFAGMDLITTSGFDAYEDAIAQWVGPPVNALYAGVEEDPHPEFGSQVIAYHALLGIPDREPVLVAQNTGGPLELRGRHPIDGATSSNVWTGLLPLSSNPSVKNPETGYLFSGNHLPVGSWFEDNLYVGFWKNGDTFRSLQLREEMKTLLPAGSDQKVSQQAIHALHFNAKSFVVDTFQKILENLEAKGHLPTDLDDPSNAITDCVAEYPHNGQQLCDPASGDWDACRACKGARVLGGLRRWTDGGAELRRRVLGSTLAGHVVGNFLLPSRCGSNPGFSDLWGEAEGGVSHFMKYIEYRVDDSFDLGAIAYVNQLVLDVAEAAWKKTLADGESWDVAQWQATALGAIEVLPSSYQKNYTCLLEGAGNRCSIDDATQPDALVVDMAIDAWHVHTLNSAYKSSYPATVYFDDIDTSVSVLPPGVSERPTSPYFHNTLPVLEAKSRGEVDSLPLAPTHSFEWSVP